MKLTDRIGKIQEFPEVKNLKQAEELRVLQWSVIAELLDINKHNGALVAKLEDKLHQCRMDALGLAFEGQEPDKLPN